MSESLRLSESHMWHELRDYYQNEGVAAWTSDTIPFFATNNPALAKTYTDLLLAYIDDLKESGNLQLEHPVTIVELGGGAGRLAYLMLTRLARLKDSTPARVTYLLTDYSSGNVEHYLGHEKLKPFLENGTLKVQRFDAESSDKLDLDATNPVFAIANYLFDSLSHDGFRLRNGVLHEAHCRRKAGGEVELSFPEAGSAPYQEKLYNQVLSDYARTLGNTHFPFPIGSLRCLRSLSEQSGGKMILMMADKALRNLEELSGFDSLPVQKHKQSFSMSVNCHALDQVWQAEGGHVYHSAVRSHPLNIALYLKGLKPAQALRTEGVFREQIDGFGPLDYLDFREHILGLSQRTLTLCMQLLRLSRWDAELLYELSNSIGEQALTASLPEQRELYDTLTRCWDNFFPIGDDRDVPFAVARVLACLNQFDQAVGFYGESFRLYGERALTHHNVGICQFNLGKLEEARKSFMAALAVDSSYGPSKELLIRLEEEEKRRAKLVP